MLEYRDDVPLRASFSRQDIRTFAPRYVLFTYGTTHTHMKPCGLCTPSGSLVAIPILFSQHRVPPPFASTVAIYIPTLSNKWAQVFASRQHDSVKTKPQHLDSSRAKVSCSHSFILQSHLGDASEHIPVHDTSSLLKREYAR